MFARVAEDPLAYAIDAFVSGGRTIRGRLDWDDAGRARFEISDDEPGNEEDGGLDAAPDRDAVVAQVLKLARAVRQTRQERLSRWRG